MSAAGPFDTPGPRWFSIPAHRPFVEDLARGLLTALAPLGPVALARATVLTPTRRGARALADAFVAAGGGRALLLPQIRPLGDLDEGEPPFEPGEISLDVPPAVSSRRRRFELARLVADHAHLLDFTPQAGQALEMAKALAEFLDSCQIEEVITDHGRLDGLAEGDLAQHWQVSARFLKAILAAWPVRLDQLGLIDVSDRRVRLLNALSDQWTTQPPQGVLIAAGSTGTAPATARLLGVVAGLPQGAVVLPGLDEGLAEDAWAQVGEQHPQGAMKRLLDRFGATRADVRPWWPEADSRGRWRRRLINEALRPAEATADWLAQIDRLRAEAPDLDPIAEGLKGLSLISARTEEEAAVACALLLREALETSDLTAALVTPDQELARRVSARLARWGVVADSSAGAPLAASPAAILAQHVAALAIDPLDPVRLLAVAKHPLLRADAFAARDLELKGLRGPAPRDADQLLGKLDKHPEAQALALRVLAAARQAATPYVDDQGSPAAAARALVESLEALAAPGDLWAGSAGESLASLLSSLITDGVALPPASAIGFSDLLDRLVNEETLRVGGATHPRLRIFGAIEARMVRADRLILAGLEEGIWPKNAPIDPFLSRPMRERLGLPPPERRIGLTAHDFAQAAAAPDVILVHSERRGGAPAVESRWLWRLRTLARGAGLTLPERPDVLAWARDLDAPGPYAPIARPAPAPPVADRPRKMAVTRVEALTRDPYAVWARDILKLYPLDRPDEPVEARARGTAIHAAFEKFAEQHPGPVPADAAEIFAGLYLSELVAAGMPPAALARERALAREAALWVADLETRRRAGAERIVVEAAGSLTFDIGGRPFTVTAKADRIEPTADGLAHILDYKTGAAPSKKQVETGFSPQLTLTAAILREGGFPDIGPREPGDLTYLRVTGRKPAGVEEVRAAAGVDSQEAAIKALNGLRELVERYDNPAQPYLSRVAPQFVHDHAGDYGHLARVFEWSTSGDDGEGGE
ncbi:double-strand break repair protein AddB, alphaproteobacterial type [Caulobacter sp. AP07]|uniref:double-strand break repair protein AddB n=1 Tax=Caulobacter sp. AP07 TaxID=1144304 RepID=UPI000271F7C1|nr:double-strand break repair protein AddB [Caulobacter sp. AP07]EJL30490.1 double-strand break repair protein AddB, alphaproteobacterial type [Caulobacter sp. AP07]